MKKSSRLGLILVGNKLSDTLLSAKTTLPTLLSSAGAPAWMAQLLVPIRESGSLLPQMLFAYLLRRTARRDIAWQISMLVQFIAGVVMMIIGLSFEGAIAGYGVLLALLLMSFSRALSSLTTKDIQGQHIEKGSRGKLLGSASTVSSAISIAVALVALFGSQHVPSDKLIIVAAIALTTKLMCMWLMRPLKTYVDTQQSPVSKGLYFDMPLAKFVAVRSLFAHTALLAPIFVLSYQGDMLNILAYLIIAQSFANFVSSYIWGWVSDVSALNCMRAGSIVAICAACALLLLPTSYPDISNNAWFIIVLFFVLSVGHQGVRTGRKIYSVDIAEQQHRTEFIATSNTLVGLSIIALGGLYALINAYSSELSLLLMSAALCLGLIGSLFLTAEK
ncbi:MFS transporter [Glaciecola sp. SC05]|uniref:MFS transporter n=1 Tax=Glaciecola sp. SC05 TaxID=1987355 RepID=UPI00352810B5